MKPLKRYFNSSFSPESDKSVSNTCCRGYKLADAEHNDINNEHVAPRCTKPADDTGCSKDCGIRSTHAFAVLKHLITKVISINNYKQFH